MERSTPTNKNVERRWKTWLLISFVVLNVALVGIRVYDGSNKIESQSESESESQSKSDSKSESESEQNRTHLLRSNSRMSLSAVEMEAVHTKDEHGNPNINIDEANSGYKPTYHYTSPHPSSSSSYLMKDSTTFHDSEVFDPQIAWLASFPNSGTSFTMGLVARATNTTFATNYGIEANFGNRGVPSLPIYPRHPEGPFMPDPVTSFHHRQLPYGKDHYVLTKTHCGGYCFGCKPNVYAYGYTTTNNNDQNTTTTTTTTATPGLDFLSDCASGKAIDDHGNTIRVSYPPERVARVVHLVRNPMHNLIARFHLDRKHHSDAGTTDDELWLASHPDNPEGMSKFCDEENQLLWDQEQTFFESQYFFPRNNNNNNNTTTTNNDNNNNGESGTGTGTGTSYTRRNGSKSSSPTESRFPQDDTNNNGDDFEKWRQLVSKVPCRADLFRYVQWHNLLHQSLDYLPTKLPVLTLYYEGFESTTYESTAKSLLDFLQLQPVKDDRGNTKWSEFHSRSDYDDFFSAAQTESIKEFLKTLSSFRVWGEIEHYFR